MQIKSMATAFMTAAFLGFGSAATAAPLIVMDETTNNGYFSQNAASGVSPNRGSWAASEVNRPAGWQALPDSVPSFPWTQNGGFSMATLLGYFNDVAVNNTGFTVNEGEVFSITALANSTQPTMGVLVEVVATANSDGTGDAVTLATAALAAGTADPTVYPFPANTNPELLPILGTGLAAPSEVDGYFLQVRASSDLGATGYFYVDNINVTSTPAVIPEPATAMLFSLGAATLLVRRRRAA